MKNTSLDGLRGIGAFTVIITHFLGAFYPSSLHHNFPHIFPLNENPSLGFQIATSPFFTILFSGGLALMVFFVLSGYVLTIPYFRDGAVLPLQKRAWGRYLRLNIPIASVILIAWIVHALGLYVNVPAAELSGSTRWLGSFFPADATGATALADALWRAVFFGNGTFDPPLWTLRIEFVGSLYLLVFYMLKPRERTLLPLALCFLFIHAVHRGDSLYFYAIFAGALLHQVKIKGSWRWPLALAGLYFGSFQFGSIVYDFLPGVTWGGEQVWDRKTIYHTIGAVMLTTAVIDGFGRGFLESRPVQFLAKISFSMYLLHMIVLCSLSCAIYLYAPHSRGLMALNLVVYLAVCVLASIVFERVVDRRAIDWSHRFAQYLFRKPAAQAAAVRATADKADLPR